MTIRIDTYHSEDAPEHRRWMSFIVVPGKRDHATIFFRGPTQEHVRNAAQSFWNEELAKTQAKADAAAKRAERRKARAS